MGTGSGSSKHWFRTVTTLGIVCVGGDEAEEGKAQTHLSVTFVCLKRGDRTSRVCVCRTAGYLVSSWPETVRLCHKTRKKHKLQKPVQSCPVIRKYSDVVL